MEEEERIQREELLAVRDRAEVDAMSEETGKDRVRKEAAREALLVEENRLNEALVHICEVSIRSRLEGSNLPGWLLEKLENAWCGLRGQQLSEGAVGRILNGNVEISLTQNSSLKAATLVLPDVRMDDAEQREDQPRQETPPEVRIRRALLRLLHALSVASVLRLAAGFNGWRRTIQCFRYNFTLRTLNSALALINEWKEYSTQNPPIQPGVGPPVGGLIQRQAELMEWREHAVQQLFGSLHDPRSEAFQQALYASQVLDAAAHMPPMLQRAQHPHQHHHHMMQLSSSEGPVAERGVQYQLELLAASAPSQHYYTPTSTPPPGQSMPWDSPGSVPAAFQRRVQDELRGMESDGVQFSAVRGNANPEASPGAVPSFEALDRNGDGFISRREWDAAMCSNSNSNEESAFKYWGSKGPAVEEALQRAASPEPEWGQHARRGVGGRS